MEFQLIEVSYTKNRRGLPVFTYRHNASGQDYEFHGQQPTERELAATHAEFAPQLEMDRLLIQAYLSGSPQA